MEKLIERVQKSQHGFLDIQKAADEVLAGLPAGESYPVAREMFSSEIHQVRALAAFILGRLSAHSPESLAFLKQRSGCFYPTLPTRRGHLPRQEQQ